MEGCPGKGPGGLVYTRNPVDPPGEGVRGPFDGTPLARSGRTVDGRHRIGVSESLLKTGEDPEGTGVGH